MSIANLEKRLEKLQSVSSKHLRVVSVIAPPEPDIEALSKGADIVIVRRIVEPPQSHA